MEVLTCSAQKVWTDQPRLTPYTYRVVLHDFVYGKCFFRGIVDVQFSIVLTTIYIKQGLCLKYVKVYHHLLTSFACHTLIIRVI